MHTRWLALAVLFAVGCDKLAAGQQPNAQCVRDDHCAIVPAALTCCPDESCPPAPPFEAAPTWVVDGMYIENEDRCLRTELTCAPAQCPPVPAGCHARAACVDGRCEAVSIGCGLPTS